MSLKIELNQKCLHFYENLDYQHSEPRNEMTDSSTDYNSTSIGFSIESLTEDLKPVSTEERFDSRDESVLLAFLRLLRLPGFQRKDQSKWFFYRNFLWFCKVVAGYLDTSMKLFKPVFTETQKFGNWVNTKPIAQFGNFGTQTCKYVEI